MSARCTGEPVSWLRLERYHLGEIPEAERAAIASHLGGCPACAACLASIEQDDAVALPRLPVARLERRGGFGPRAQRAALLASGLALAAALALTVGSGWRHGRTEPPSEPTGGAGAGGGRVKGDAIAFSLVRDDSEWIVEAGGSFRDGDRFKAVVTCPPSLAATFDLVVYDGSGASFPLAPARIACGNDVPLPGAFRLAGSEIETVCLVWDADGDPSRSALATGVAVFGERAVCKRLTAARGVGPR